MLRNISLLLILATAIARVDKCPKHCTCSQDLASCNSTNFTSFGERIFKLKITNPKLPLIIKNGLFNVSGLQDLDSLQIESATILDINDKAFLAIPKLSSLSIINSNIPHINDPLTFIKSKKLRILKISNSTLNKFESIKSKSLEELDLSGNRLTTITKSSFEFLPSLTFINLENNNISTVNPSAFSNLDGLQDILLSNNNITYLDPNIFENNTEIVSLNLSKNPLKQISLHLISDLEKLVLKSCQLKTFNEDFSNNLMLLSYLDLSDNNIAFTENSFAKMEELEFLDLSNNNLTKLHPRMFFSNSHLQKMIFNNNVFAEFPKLETQNHFETYYLSCSNCSITTLAQDAFKHFASLAILNLSHNKLNGTSLIVLQSLYNLVELDLSYNKIATLNTSWFTKSSGLQTVNLAGNPLKVINPKVFYFNRVLKHLDVSNCALETLWQQPSKKNLNSLYELNIANNQLTSVSPRDLEMVPSIKVLGVSNNLLHCDEVLRNTINWLTKHKVMPLSPLSKTHENSINAANSISVTVLNSSSWRVLAKERCLDEFYFESTDDADEKIPDNKISVNPKTKDDPEIENNTDDEDDDSYLYNDDEYLKSDEDYARAKQLYESIQYKTENRTKYSFLWPTLVFIFTALSVLVIAANVLLLILRTKAIPRQVNLPHIKIPRWNTNNRLKKHSGSVYQPLSEERTEMFIPNRASTILAHSAPKSSL